MPDPTVYTPSTLPVNDNLNPYCFCVDVAGEMFIRKGKMIAYYGDLRFESLALSALELIVRQSFNSTAHLDHFVVVSGRGKLILGDVGHNLASYNLEDGNLTVKTEHVLGFSRSIVCQECVLPGYLTLLGTGIFLASSNGPVHFLEPPVRVDEQALLGWADLPCPSYRYDYNYARGIVGALGTAIGGHAMASGEEKQLDFTGKGTVLIQSSEEALNARSDLETLLGQLGGFPRHDLETIQTRIRQRLAGQNS